MFYSFTKNKYMMQGDVTEPGTIPLDRMGAVPFVYRTGNFGKI